MKSEVGKNGAPSEELVVLVPCIGCVCVVCDVSRVKKASTASSKSLLCSLRNLRAVAASTLSIVEKLETKSSTSASCRWCGSYRSCGSCGTTAGAKEFSRCSSTGSSVMLVGDFSSLPFFERPKVWGATYGNPSAGDAKSFDGSASKFSCSFEHSASTGFRVSFRLPVTRLGSERNFFRYSRNMRRGIGFKESSKASKKASSQLCKSSAAKIPCSSSNFCFLS